jgi:hypothetical protein
MVVLLHGAAGGWDEVAIAVAAFAVLWVAVKLAGRKPASDDDVDEDLDAESAADGLHADAALATAEERKGPAHSPSDRG